MGKLIIKNGITSSEVSITGLNLLRVVMRVIPLEILPAGITYLDFDFYVDGQLIDLRTYDIDRAFKCDVKIIIPPKVLSATAAAWMGYISIAISVASIAASFLLQPDTPSSESTTDSPNNSLFGQTNLIRLNELEPDIYGFLTSYPDLIVQEGGSWEYIDNIKWVDEVFLIGVGQYETSEPRYESTPFSDIADQTYAFYENSELVPVVQGQFNSEAVDGQVLLGPNNDETDDTFYAATTNGVLTNSPSAGYVNMTVPITPAWTVIYNEISSGDFGDKTPVEISYEIEDADNNEREDLFGTGQLYNMGIDLGTHYTIDIWCDNLADPPNIYWVPTGVMDLLLLSKSSYLDVVLPVAAQEIQISFEFLRGLKGTAELTVYINGVSGAGGEIQENYTYTANTINQRFYTEKIQIPTAQDDDVIEVRVIRTNDDNANGTTACQLTQVATNAYRYDVNYGNRTILTTRRKANTSAVTNRDSKVNVDVTRKTVTYDGTNIITTLAPSRSFADCILHRYTQIFGLDGNDLPLDDMYQYSGFFDYTFGDKEMSLKEAMNIAANVARCTITSTGSGYGIFRNEARPVSAQLDSRNISMESDEEYSYRGASPVSNDGVQLRYKNQDDNAYEYIHYVLVNGVSTICVYNNDGTYTPALGMNPFEIDLIGCSDYDQANERADLECRSLVYIQKTLSTTVLQDGLDLVRGQVVRHSDYYQDDVTSGEISAINGNTFTTHNKIDLTGSDYYVTYTDENGDTHGPIACTIIDENNFNAVMPLAYLADGYSIQSGTRYIISTLEEHANNLYEITDVKPNSDGTVTLDLIEYNEAIYPEEDA